MEEDNGYLDKDDAIQLVDLQYFYSKSKVPICLAVTELSLFLDAFTEAGCLSEEESLEFQADPRPAQRVVYECLCCIEEKNCPLQLFFKVLFQKPFLKRYPDLKAVFKDYLKKNYRNGTQITVDQDKDQIIFAQEKVKICLAVKDIFPFIHGLQDLTYLTETESLRFQADDRPVSRVIYDCLSLIEKKDMKISIIFQYIFQHCYQNLYPGLKIILQGSSQELLDQLENHADYLEDFYEENKHEICSAIDQRFPFLHGLYDIQLLSKLQLLKFQADKRATSEVLGDILSLIQEEDEIDLFLHYAFQQFFLSLFPGLKIILKRFKKTLKLNMCTTPSEMEDIMTLQIRKCRMKPVSYMELSEDWDFVSEEIESGEYHKEKAGEVSPRNKLGKRRHTDIKVNIPKIECWDPAWGRGWIKAALNVHVRLEFPKEVIGDEFRVDCGHKRGIFMKKFWTGDSRNDRCIRCDNSMFKVIEFEKYGGRETFKNWKKSIRCAGMPLEKLFQAGVLKPPRYKRKRITVC
ncbi:nuclear body protein SP140-like protein [Hyperolius riggenbachi]|uniref:nuclear body protein SP140-like protein n=1 Tax=Hyperolius riggenbachi TaxID=752182 RepID=UPI0035A3D616